MKSDEKTHTAIAVVVRQPEPLELPSSEVGVDARPHAGFRHRDHIVVPPVVVILPTRNASLGVSIPVVGTYTQNNFGAPLPALAGESGAPSEYAPIGDKTNIIIKNKIVGRYLI